MREVDRDGMADVPMSRARVHRHTIRARITARRALGAAAVAGLAILSGASYIGYRRWQQQERRAQAEAERRARDVQAAERKAAQDEEIADLLERISRANDIAERARLRAELEKIKRDRNPDAGSGARFVDRCMPGDPMCPFDL